MVIKIFKDHLRITTGASVGPHYILQNTVPTIPKDGVGAFATHMFSPDGLCSSLYIF